MEYGLDVVAIGIADEGTEVAGVILGPDPRCVQRFRAECDRGVMERADLVVPGGFEGEVNGRPHLPITGVFDPEVRFAVSAIADGVADVHLPAVAQHGQDGVVEPTGLGEVRADDSEVISHSVILASAENCDVDSANGYGLVIRNGTIVDGLGGEPFVGGVAVQHGVIVAVGTIDGAAGAREIDATGLLVTPGFVDPDTHHDGQVIWSDRMTPSSAHGVTTAVMGNCGVGFAPCRPAITTPSST